MSGNDDLVKKLEHLLDEIHFTGNILLKYRKVDGISTLYLNKIQDIESEGRKIFNENFPLKRDYEIYFFGNLNDARRYEDDPGSSLFHLRDAEKYVRNLIKLLG